MTILYCKIMTNNNYTLTRVLVGGLKWSGKQSFIFFVLTLLVIGGTISASDPVVDDHYLTQNKSTIVAEKYLTDEPVQIGVSTFDAKVNVELIIYRLQFKTVDDNETILSDRRSSGAEEVLTQIFRMNGPEFLEERVFEEGTYRFVVTADENVQILFGEAQVNHGAAILTVILLLIFTFSFTIFWTIFPFAIAVLIINAMKPAPAYKVGMDTKTKKKDPFMKSLSRPIFEENTYFSKLTNAEWAWLGVALFFFIMFFVEPEGPFFFLTVIIGIGVFYGVTEREKMKDRILILLEHYPETSVEFLAKQLGKKKKKDVIKVLQIMILDDAYPIQLNLSNNKVIKVGEFQSSTPIRTEVPVQAVNHTVQVKAPVKETVVEKKVEEKKPLVEQIEDEAKFCNACGEHLVASVSYCYACGQKI